MSFLIDSDICSAHLRGTSGLANRFLQYTGRLHISVLTLGELFELDVAKERTAKIPPRAFGIALRC